MGKRVAGYGKNHYFGDAFDRSLYEYKGWSKYLKSYKNHKNDRTFVVLHFIKGVEVYATLSETYLGYYEFYMKGFKFLVKESDVKGLCIRMEDVYFESDDELSDTDWKKLYDYIFKAESYVMYTTTGEPVKVASSLREEKELVIEYKGKRYFRSKNIIGKSLFYTLKDARESANKNRIRVI